MLVINAKHAEKRLIELFTEEIEGLSTERFNKVFEDLNYIAKGNTTFPIRELHNALFYNIIRIENLYKLLEILTLMTDSKSGTGINKYFTLKDILLVLKEQYNINFEYDNYLKVYKTTDICYDTLPLIAVYQDFLVKQEIKNKQLKDDIDKELIYLTNK